MRRVLVTGAKGQLGTDMVLCLQRHSELYRVFGYGRADLDITNGSQLAKIFEQVKPDIVIHTAAYTQVDQAETDRDRAYAVNALGTRNLVIEAEKYGAKFVYLSTDYVFDGQKETPYCEYDRTNPQTVYGQSKWAGEEFVLSLSNKYFIVRTSWVYGKYGVNFVKTMLRLGKEGKLLKVVDDQFGSPTYTVDLAGFLQQLIETERYGIYHASNSGSCSWYEFAKKIFEISGMEVDLNPCKTADFPRPAPRPEYSVLDHTGIRLNGFQDLRPWQEGLESFLSEKNFLKKF
ncbi:dTDP-4-dehydrorhamnose reductase [Desulfosporosinus hippei]|uniref:dTDP-4-dehydrorhamnose reductase n=1 Tax=Desulfosporosinus hippei DSM 8344 TaxID=1121419 RepID=A0A1G8HHN2_9FIRM|nr:dTDP-4-dehydrorhamnose reductase [Desulfosporosinus hippei]SDI06194.1 dTDP-4-dehydrorhamnose reductase [Desulfosporosinus hippei DSM 8344]